jgi:hypothetical protein
MTDAELNTALDIVVARTHHERFRALCLVDGTVTPWTQAGYQALIGVLATDPPPTGRFDVPEEAIVNTPAARRYGLTPRPRCGCGGGACAVVTPV